MRVPKILSKSFVLALLLVPIGAAQGEADTHTASKSFATDGAREVSVHFPVGDLKIQASDGKDVEATLTARCRFGGRGCERRAEGLRLVSKRRGDRLQLKLDGYPKFELGGLQVDLKLLVPRSLPLSVHMGVGAAEVRGLSRDVEIHMGVGDVEVRGSGKSVGSVRAHVGIGDAELRHAGQRVEGSGFIAQKLRWQEGPGRGRVEVHLGIGSVDVALR